ncbi:NB-ARC domain-containing protein [Adonisia turfae]|uniref:NACHT domain-containing protein n=1 Tax=Adonisia turfae CCMR0081 TaxID=2292702 RepID=A0A6M0RHP3_9CYAN|nr:NB-ARC domain-containing protein [Adonisia turfae]NEZ55383.1 hypothetical protein [Adonisia turfae CCMR0081]
MPRRNDGPKAYEKARRLLEVMLAYVNDEIEDCEHIRPHIEIHWKTDKCLVIKTKTRYLEALTSLESSGPALKRSDVSEAINRLKDHVGILDDYRTVTKGSELRHFALNLWYGKSQFMKSDNLQRIHEVWEANRSKKSKEVGGDITPVNLVESASLIETVKDNRPWQGASNKHSWGEAPDVSKFYGRQAELATLQTWIVDDGCRLITVLGMGGMGKSALSVKLAQQLESEFEKIIWRSLWNAPPLQTLLQDLLLILSGQQVVDINQSVDAGIVAVLKELRNCRCLVILDNFESLLQAERMQGSYCPGYEDYGHLLQSLADSPHKSCLLLTSREKPIGLSAKEGLQEPVRAFQLTGLQVVTANSILQDQQLDTTIGRQLVDQYNGNPLALKIAIATIQSLFDGNVTAFLAAETVVFGDIADLLAQQIKRLSFLERQIMEWLAICREPVSIAVLSSKLIPTVKSQALLDALTALQRRSLIERDSQSQGFTQQPVVMEYMTEQIIDQCCELIWENTVELPGLLSTLALMEADAKDYIRQTQQRVIVALIARQLKDRLGSGKVLRTRCEHILQQLHEDSRPGYAAGNLINLMQALQLDLSGYDFSGLCVWQVYLSDLALPETNFSKADLSRSVFTQTLGGFLAVAYHPGGQQLATAISNEVVVWDIGQGKQLLAGQGHTAWVMCVAYSLDGKLIATGSRDETIRLWDAETGQCMKTLPCPGSWVQTVVFSPDGQYLVSGGSDGAIRVWEVATSCCQWIWEGHCDRILALKFSADGQTLVSSSMDQATRVWDFASGDCLHTWEISINWTLAMDLSSDGSTLVTGSDGNLVKLWDLATGKCRFTLPDYRSYVWSVAFAQDGQTFLTSSDDKTIKLWDLATGDCLQTWLGHSHFVWLTRFSPDGQSVVSASNDQTVKVWDVTSGQCLQTLITYSNWLQSVAFSPDGEYLVSGGEDQQVRLWQTVTGDCIRRLSGHTNQVSSVVFSSDGRYIASGSDDATIRLWNATSGEYLRTLRGHTDGVQSVVFSSVGNILASGSYDKTVRLWDVTSGECLQILAGHLQRIKAVAFSIDGAMVASGSDDHTLKLWAVGSGACLHTLEGHGDWVLAVAFHPQQSWVASGSGDHTIKIWDIVTGECLQTLEKDSQRVRSVAFSLDGRYLASCGDDATVYLWDVETGECQRSLTEHSSAVWSVEFSPDGRYLVSCSEDETIRLWDLKTGICTKVLRPQRPYENMNITNVVGLTVAQRNTLKALGAVENASR